MTSPRVQVHVRRLVIDADVLEGAGVPADFDARLQASLQALLASGAVETQQPRWQGALSRAVASRIHEVVPALPVHPSNHHGPAQATPVK
jgi:hypothetical protein